MKPAGQGRCEKWFTGVQPPRGHVEREEEGAETTGEPRPPLTLLWEVGDRETGVLGQRKPHHRVDRQMLCGEQTHVIFDPHDSRVRDKPER